MDKTNPDHRTAKKAFHGKLPGMSFILLSFNENPVYAIH